MKLQKLTIHNIASIERAEIEFDKGSLAQEPLFLITGRTGAGKTTILNAICLALYNEVPCLTDVKDDRNRNDDVKISSPLQLMRKGSLKSEVTLTFESGGAGYTAKWEAHYSNRKDRDGHRKLLDSRSLTINATGETLTKVTEINAQILTTVGLTFEQFTRTTMLAQGQFAAFMRAREKDKAEILEKLTGTEIYTCIGRSIFELTKEAEALHSRISADISEIKLLKEEEEAEIKEKINALSLEATAASLRIAEIDKQLEWLRGYERLQKSLAQTQAEYDGLTAIKESEEYQEKKTGIERYDGTAEIRAQIRRGEETEKQITVLSAELVAYRKDKARKIADGLCHIQKNIADAQERYGKLAAEIAEMEPMARVYSDIQRVEEKASRLKSLIDRRLSAEKHVRDTEKDLKKSHEAEKPLKERIDTIEKESAGLEAELKDIDSKLANYDRSVLTSGKTAVDNEILRLSRIEQLIETLTSRRSDLEETVKREGENTGNLNTSKIELEELEARIPRLTADFNKLNAFLDGQKTLADHIGQLRSLYAESHTCPLCGNTHAEMPTDDTINELLKASKKKVEEARLTLVDAKARHKTLKDSISALSKLGVELMEEERRKRKLADSTLSELKATGCDNPDEIDPVKLSQDCSDLEERSRDYDKKIREMDSLAAEREMVLKHRDINISKKEEAQKKLQKQQEETIRLSEKSGHQQDALRDTNKDIDDNLGQLGEMIGTKLSIDRYEAVMDGLKKESYHYLRLKESLSECEKEIAGSTQVYANCNDLLPESFRSYIEGYSPIPKELVNPEVKISEYGNALSRMSGEIESCENQLADIRKHIDAFFADASLSREEVDEIAGMSENTVRQWREEIKEVSEKLTRNEGALNVINRQISDHNGIRPAIPAEATIDSLSSEKEQGEKKRDTAKEANNNLSKSIEDNERLRKTCRERIAQREEAAIQLNEWNLLNKIFGNADGGKFRAIAQSYVLRALLVRANGYLSLLSSRYTLDCKDGSLAIDVIDTIRGNTVRNVSLLSGGESFVVSLALALGLSAISKDKIDVDILFIDEGFGTLDHETLETVIETLDTLHRRGGRRIGIISHVTQLAERIGTQIRLVPDGPGVSRVEIK